MMLQAYGEGVGIRMESPGEEGVCNTWCAYLDDLDADRIARISINSQGTPRGLYRGAGG